MRFTEWAAAAGGGSGGSGGGGRLYGRVLVWEGGGGALVHLRAFSLPSLRSLLAAATVFVNKYTRKLCAATDTDAVKAEVGKEAEAAQAARQAAKGE